MEAIFLFIGQYILLILIILFVISMIFFAYFLGKVVNQEQNSKIIRKYLDQIDKSKTVIAKNWIIEETNSIKSNYALVRLLSFLSKEEEKLNKEELNKISQEIMDFYTKQNILCKKNIAKVQKYLYPCIGCVDMEKDKEEFKCFYCAKNNYKDFVSRDFTDLSENFTGIS